MHNAALASLAASDARFADWRYFRFEVHPDDLPRALELFREEISTASTSPSRTRSSPSTVLATVDPAARPIGAVNTLLLTPAGWRGHNTDGYGLAGAIRETLGLDLAGAHIVLLGAGGAARGAAVECLQRRCASLWIANRTETNLTAMLADLAPLAAGIPSAASPPPLLPSISLPAPSSSTPPAPASAPPTISPSTSRCSPTSPRSST